MVGVAGRVMFVRNTGKLCFATLQEGAGVRLQVMLSLAEVGEEAARRVEAHRRPRRPRLRRGPRHLLAPRRAVGDGHPLGDGLQGAAPAAGAAPRPLRGGAGPAAVRRPDRPAGGARHGPHPRRRSPARCATTLQDEGYLEIETPVLQLIHGGADGPPVPHPHQRLRPGDDAAHRPGAEPQEGRRRRRRQGLRDRPHLPQRGRRLHAQPRVHDARGLPGLRRPVHDGRPDAAHGPGRRRRRGLPADRDRGRHHRPRRRVALAAGLRRGQRGRRRDGHAGHRRGDAARHPRPGTSSSSTRPGRPRTWSSSCSASWSSRACCSRRSSATTRRRPSRWPARTAPTRA